MTSEEQTTAADMGRTKFRKKPVVIEAVQFTGGNYVAVEQFVCDPASFSIGVIRGVYKVFINTLEGTMTVSPGDWIIKGVNGEYYPCKPDIFEKTYERVEE